MSDWLIVIFILGVLVVAARVLTARRREG